MGRPGHGSGATALAALVAAFVAAGLVGCAATDQAAKRHDPAEGSPSPPSQQAADRSSLTIAVENPAGGWRSYRLTCDPDGGSHPMPTLACRALGSSDQPFQSQAEWEQGRRCFPLPSNQHAVITGTWRGEDVAVKYDQTTTCAAQRWGEIAVVFVPLNAAATDPLLLD